MTTRERERESASSVCSCVGETGARAGVERRVPMVNGDCESDATLYTDVSSFLVVGCLGLECGVKGGR